MGLILVQTIPLHNQNLGIKSRFGPLVMFLDLDLGDDDKAMRSLMKTIENIEDGLGADGVGHGQLKPPQALEDQVDSET